MQHLLVVMPSLLFLTEPVTAQWSAKQEFYVEHRESGVQTYYSPELYVEIDPKSQNYREYRYDLKYGKDYYWKNYDGAIFSEREFTARYNQLSYYTDSNDELKEWGMQMGVAAAIAAGCCFTITICIVFAQCIIIRRQRKRELKTMKELAEMEGLGGIEAYEDTEDNITKEAVAAANKGKKQRMKTNPKKEEALKKIAIKEVGEPIVVVDFSRDNIDIEEHIDGSRREMLSGNDSVGPASTSRKASVIGNSRLDPEENREKDVPNGNEDGEDFF